MKKLVIGIFLMSLVLLSMVSCTSKTQAVVQTSVVVSTETVTKVSPPTTVIDTVTATVIKVVDPISGNEYTIDKGKVGVANVDASANNYFNGLDAHWIGLVLNGDDTEHQFNVSVTP